MYCKLEKAFAKIQDIVYVIIGIALVLMVLIILAQTFTRYVIFYSLSWSEELSRYLFVLIIMFGLSIAIRDDMLISIDLIDYVLPAKLQKYLRVLRQIVALVLSIVIVFSCQQLFPVGMIQKSPAMRIPMIIMYSVIFAGYLLSAMSLVFKIADDIRTPGKEQSCNRNGGT